MEDLYFLLNDAFCFDFQPFRKNNSFANLTAFTNSSQPPLHRGFLKLILYLQIKIGFARAVYFGIRRGDFGAVEIICGGEMGYEQQRFAKSESCLSGVADAFAIERRKIETI